MFVKLKSKQLEYLLELNPEEENAYLNNYQLTLASDSGVKIGNSLYAAENLKIKSDFKNITSTYLKSSVDKYSSIKDYGYINNNFFGQVETDFDNSTLDTELKIINSVQFKRSIRDKVVHLIMLNPIYFKGNWRYPFNMSETKQMVFHMNGSSQVTEFSAMKLTENLKVTFIPELESDVLELPYQNEEISMIIVLPSNNTDVFKVEKNLRNFDARFLVRNLDLINASSVKVILPKFEKGIFVSSLTEELLQLDVSDLVFIHANLTNMIDDYDKLLVASQMDHLGGVKVNEGSQLADEEIKTRNVSSIDSEFVVNKPFIFYIYDRINHLPILFGRIVDPNGERNVEQYYDYDYELTTSLLYMDKEEEKIEPTDETPLPAAANMDVQTTETK